VREFRLTLRRDLAGRRADGVRRARRRRRPRGHRLGPRGQRRRLGCQRDRQARVHRQQVISPLLKLPDVFFKSRVFRP